METFEDVLQIIHEELPVVGWIATFALRYIGNNEDFDALQSCRAFYQCHSCRVLDAEHELRKSFDRGNRICFLSVWDIGRLLPGGHSRHFNS